MKRLMLSAVLALSLVGCGGAINPVNRDLEGIAPEEPDNVRIFFNADGFPNIGVFCADGVGFAFTNRFGDHPGQLIELSQESTAKVCA